MLKKVFSIKSFIIFILIIFVTSICIIKYKNYQQYKLIEDMKNGDTDKVMRSVAGGKKVSMQDILDYCGWRRESIYGITFGVNHTGEGISRYYLENEEFVKEVLNRIDGWTIYGGKNRDEDLFGEQIWNIQLFSDATLYSLYVTANETISSACDMLSVRTCSKLDVGTVYDTDPDPAGALLNNAMCQLLYDENMNEFFTEMYEKYVSEISKEDLQKIANDEKTAVKTYFKYSHTPKNSKFVENQKTIYIYKFPIKDTKCYLEIDLDDVNTNPNFSTKGILRAEIYDETGEFIDYFSVSDEEIEEFLNREK